MTNRLWTNRLQKRMRRFQAVKDRKRLQMLKKIAEDVEDLDNEEEEEEEVAGG